MTAKPQSTEIEVRARQADGRSNGSGMLLVPDCDEPVAVGCVDEHKLDAFEAFVQVPDARRPLAARHERGFEDLEAFILRLPRDWLDDALVWPVEVQGVLHLRLGEMAFEVEVHLDDCSRT